MNCMTDTTRCPLTLILAKTQIILSNMKPYENGKKVSLYEVPKFGVRCISGHKWMHVQVMFSNGFS